MPALTFVVPSFRLRTGSGDRETNTLHASLFVQLPTSAVPDYRRFGRKVTFWTQPEQQPAKSTTVPVAAT